MFVAVSINIGNIVHSSRLTTRAGTTLALLINILLISTVALIGGIDPAALGALVLLTAGVLWVFVVATLVRRGLDPELKGRSAFQAVLHQVALVPLLVGGIVLADGGGATGLVWVAAGFVLSFLVAVVNAWVLLIEILR